MQTAPRPLTLKAERPVRPFPAAGWGGVLHAVPFAAIIAFVAWYGHVFSDDRHWLSIGAEALFLAAAVSGLNILLGYTGLLSLGHAAFFVIGGYIGAVWAPEWGLDPWLGFPVAFVLGAALGTVLALMCCHLRGLYLTVVTFAFGGLVVPIANVYDTLFGGSLGRSVTKPLDVANLPGANGNPYLGLLYLSAVWLLVALLLVSNLIKSRWGRAYQAIRESEIAASASGVNVYWYKVSSFALSAGIVSVSGVLGAQLLLSVNPGLANANISFQYVVMAAIGGMGTLIGPVLGAFGISFSLAQTWAQEHFGEHLPLFYGVAGLAIVVAAPEGVVGRVRGAGAAVGMRLRAHGGSQGSQVELAGAASTIEAVQPRGRRVAGGSVEDAALVLDVKGLGKRFGGLMALEGIDLAVRHGSIHGLIGPNGSGKTTFVNLLTGFYKPTTGTIMFEGHDVTGLGTHRRGQLGVARTFQNLQLCRRLSVIENVMVGGHARTRVGLGRSLLRTPGCRREQRELRAHSLGLLAFVGLADRAGDLAGTLAFSDQRRLEIARALAGDPELLLLDEPAAGMHPSEVQGLIELIARVRNAGITVLLIEHHMELVMALCDTVTVFDSGRKLAEGSSAHVRQDQQVIEAYLGTQEVA